MKIPKWQHELARYYKREKLVSYFLNNAAKTCLYGLKISENIEIGHFFQSRTFFHLSSKLYTSCLSAFNLDYYIDQKASLKKKLKACYREAVQIKVKPKNNLVMQLNTAAFQFLYKKCCLFLFKTNN